MGPREEMCTVRRVQFRENDDSESEIIEMKDKESRFQRKQDCWGEFLKWSLYKGLPKQTVIKAENMY